ncbi:MAG TPA: hypothetical protein VMG12_09060 [Polyangiaceae bacterium]|nr:hypothetical protein [Polyangiaceae bacterium]
MWACLSGAGAVLLGCSSSIRASHDGDYERAVHAARDPGALPSGAPLVAITQDNDPLVWRDSDRLLMARWARRCDIARSLQGQPEAGLFDTEPPCAIEDRELDRLTGVTSRTTRELWLVAEHELRGFCERLPPEQRDARLRQWLGLPPGDEKDVIVEYWVEKKDLVRPCPDESVGTDRCVLVPSHGVSPQGPRSWRCGDTENAPARPPAGFSSVAHWRWMCKQWQASYAGSSTHYPFTGQGYTYDWAVGSQHQGASEFVLKSGSMVELHSMTLADVYCAEHPAGL